MAVKHLLPITYLHVVGIVSCIKYAFKEFEHFPYISIQFTQLLMLMHLLLS